jgi:hypothetical protein
LGNSARNDKKKPSISQSFSPTHNFLKKDFEFEEIMFVIM